VRLCATIRVEPAIAAAIGTIEPVDGVPGTVFDTWALPVNYADPDSAWIDENYAYDDDIESFAINAWDCFGHWLELIAGAPMLCSVIRFYNRDNNGQEIYVDVHITGGAWVNVAMGTYDADQWHEISFAAMNIDKARIKLNANSELLLGEFQFGPAPEMIAECAVAARLLAETTLVECS